MFIDRIKIQLRAGRGGHGIVSWRKEKYIPKGGPNGGNGSKGGDVILQADHQILALDWFRNRRILVAENGASGGPNLRQGRQGKNLILKVPCGTLIKDWKTKEILCDLTESGQEFLACRGGKGGRGNNSFKTPTNQAPNYCTYGRAGEELNLELELKLIADIGLVGYPNAGKSTLISALTHAGAKIGAYPFTTLHPNLGYIKSPNFDRILIADIPGIIEGASSNRGLGFEFLRHVERNKGLIFVIDMTGIDGRDPIRDFEVLKSELSKYNSDLLNKPYIIALNKTDQEEALINIEIFKKAYPEELSKIFCISAMEKQGLESVVSALQDIIRSVTPVAVIEELAEDLSYHNHT